jgi:membrane-bound inhibitor of C-type lysozyme
MGPDATRSASRNGRSTRHGHAGRWLCLLVALVGCAKPGHTGGTVTAAELPTTPPRRDAYNCASGQNVATQLDVPADKLALSVDDTLVRLPQVASASGAHYSDGRISFWSKGDEATLEIDGVSTECHRTIGR